MVSLARTQQQLILPTKVLDVLSKVGRNQPVPIGLLQEDEITNIEMALVGRLFFDAFGVDYLKANSAEFAKVKLLVELCNDEGWTKKEFMTRAKEFVKEAYSNNWMPYHFMKKERESLKPYSWVLSELEKNPNAKAEMEGYYVPTLVGKPLELWRYKTGEKIPNLKRFFPPKLRPIKIIYQDGTQEELQDVRRNS